MKKFSLVAAALIAGVALNINAATVATVNGKNISDAQVGDFFAPVLRGQDFKALPDDQKRALVQQYIMQDLITQDAKKQNLEKDPLYAKELDRAKEAILLNVYQEKILNAIKIDAAKVKAFYEQNKDKYVKPARVQAKHILVASEKEAMDIISQLKGLKGKELEAKFTQLAQEKSIDSGSKNQGGELGWFDQSTMVKPFTDAAFALKNGTISTTPIKTNFGYHVILKENSQAKAQIKFEEVKQGIENALKFEEFKKVMNEKGQELLNNAKVEYK
ncbi:peptidylprolyl isomerase [Campylobacter hepaticus]|uniref:Peptidylprolyl isomerase n=1 Tax=Campylobacter hepaticus TaxID=1813019 RepID=A0A424Z1C3_9BACT|nr:peptidylprolyl isomerase [Campylobacter hepaticus]AXP08801.1 peptidylprolyl isomerase [Campylobacter hepaticus]MCZ0772652.1 peptidylprolyl isomerase [Campylobacter hepaticus]MCZ0774120.1 peptidylprolyl isomerase [Campylobacter hepaticus]MCZ0775372.1 peptidylprolyl isomerase [Campylobacter hepaticus]MDX2323085.1 peptidylprolyl isomerase [Campylobacter hepaticus]